MHKKIIQSYDIQKLAITLSIIGLTIIVLNSCSMPLKRADAFQRTFNDHAEGWLTFFGLVTMLGGWLISGASWIRKHYEFRRNGSKDVKDKHPVLPFLTINGKSLFRQFTWSRAFKTAENIAHRLTNDDSNDFYNPTLIVGIGRGGAVYGSLISYQLGELPILALERQYKHLEDGRETKKVYPIRIPKAFLKRVLLVAGESHTKETLKYFTNMLKGMGAGEIRNCVFYKQLLPEDQMASDVKIHYFGVSKKKDYLMPWQTESSLHPSENKEDAEKQNAKIERNVSEEENHFDSNESGFYCMRHAETEANAEDIFIGSRTDIPLTADGKEQACKVGLYFKNLGVTFDTIYHSPMTRCFETAREISTIAGGQLVIDKRLMELDYGNWENLTRADIESKYATDFHQYCSDMSAKPTGSSECANDVYARVSDFLQELMDPNVTMGKNTLVVTHKTAGRILLQAVGHNPSGHFRDIPFDTAAVGYVSIHDGEAKVILDNKRC